MTPTVEAQILRDAALRPTTIKLKGLIVDYEYYSSGAISKVILTGRNARRNLFDVLNMIYPRDIIVSLRKPARTISFLGAGQTLVANEERLLIRQNGEGFSDYMVFHVAAVATSERTRFRVYCDDQQALSVQPSVINGYGYGASTPQVSLTKYGVDGVCVVVVSKRFSFQQALELRAYHPTAAPTVTGWFSVDLMTT